MRLSALCSALLLVCAVFLLAIQPVHLRAKNAASASVLDQDPIPRTPARLARGRYLVNGILQCFNCHSDVDFTHRPAQPVPGKMGGGKIFSNTLLGLPPGNRVVAPNISPDPEYGAGKWKDSDFVRALRQGIGHDGRTLYPVMPYNYFHKLSDEDLAAAIVYVRSIPPVHIERPKTVLTPEIKATLQPLPPVENVAAPDRSDRVNYGAYLVNAAHCNGCHTPADDKTRQPIPDMYLAGGRVLTGPWGTDPTKEISVAALNLTPDPSGISYMNEALFVQALRTGQVKARLLANVMPWAYFRNLSDDDLKAVYAYLRTVKPVQHRVDNTELPGYCKLCRHRHGFGDRNKMAEAPSPAHPAALREDSPRR